MQFGQDDDEGGPHELDPLKVVVIGEPQVGKTSFIRAFYDHHEPEQVTSYYNGLRIYHSKFAVPNLYGRAEIFEIPATPYFLMDQMNPHIWDAKAIVLMYAIDDPLSLDMLTEKWLPQASHVIRERGIPVVLLGNKKDLRDAPQGVERLALQAETLLTFEDGADLLEYEEIEDFCEISARNLKEVNLVFDLIFHHALNLQSEISF